MKPVKEIKIKPKVPKLSKKKRKALKRKKSVFSRPHPVKRKIVVKRRKIRAYFNKHHPKEYFFRGMRKVVTGFYTVSDKVRDKIAESNMTLNHPFTAQFYEDRCVIV